MKTKLFAWGLAALIGPPLAAAAPADPTDVRISSTSGASTSAYADYVSDQDITLRSWQAANAAATDEPGHAGHGAAAAPAGDPMHGAANHPGMGADPGASTAATPPMDAHAGHGAAASAEPKKAAPTRTNVTAAAEPSAKAKASAKTKTPAPGASGTITATGNVLAIDKANGKVKVAHDPIPQIGWPKMTMYFRVKDPAVLNQATEGPAQFILEKSGSGYVISGFKK